MGQAKTTKQQYEIVEEEIDVAGQMTLDLGEHQPISALREIGNKPLLMLNTLFSHQDSDDPINITAPFRDGLNISIRLEPTKGAGVATAFDKRLMVYMISRLVQEKRHTGQVPRSLHVSISDYIKDTNTQTGGDVYHHFRAAIERLQSTRVYIGIEGEDFGVDQWFSWVQRAAIRYRKTTVKGEVRKRGTSFVIEPCEWLRHLVEKDDGLIPLDNLFFSIRSGLLSHVYEIVSTDMEHPVFKISLNELRERTSMGKDPKEFRRLLKDKVLSAHQEGESPLPKLAVYSYTAAQPKNSLKWGVRHNVKQEDQWYVFVRGEAQDLALDRALDSIPHFSAAAFENELGEAFREVYGPTGDAMTLI